MKNLHKINKDGLTDQQIANMWNHYKYGYIRFEFNHPKLNSIQGETMMMFKKVGTWDTCSINHLEDWKWAGSPRDFLDHVTYSL